MHFVIGCDPGSKGGLAVLGPEGKLVELLPLRGVQSLVSLISRYDDAFISIEKAQPMRTKGRVQGVSSTFAYAYGFGQLVGALVSLNRQFELVPPRVWQAEMFVGTETKLKPKERALIVAQRLCPTETFLLTERCKKPSDGLIDATLIAHYAFRKLGRLYAPVA